MPVPVNTVSYTVPVDGQHQVNMQSVSIQPIAQHVEHYAVEYEETGISTGISTVR